MTDSLVRFHDRHLDDVRKTLAELPPAPWVLREEAGRFELIRSEAEPPVLVSTTTETVALFVLDALLLLPKLLDGMASMEAAVARQRDELAAHHQRHTQWIEHCKRRIDEDLELLGHSQPSAIASKSVGGGKP